MIRLYHTLVDISSIFSQKWCFSTLTYLFIHTYYLLPQNTQGQRIERCPWIFLSSYRKSVFTARTYYKMLSFIMRQSQHSAALWTLSVNVCPSVSEFVFYQLEKSAKPLIFLLNSRKLPFLVCLGYS